MADKNIDIRGKKIRMRQIKGNEMFSMTDIANQFGEGPAKNKLNSWFKNHSTLDFLEAFETEYNPKVKKRNLKKFIARAKENRNALMLEDFEIEMNSPFVSTRKRNEGTWAVFEISSEFMMWIHAKFKVWFIKDYKEMKIAEMKRLLEADQLYAQKNVDNLMESLRYEQDRLENIQKKLKS